MTTANKKDETGKYNDIFPTRLRGLMEQQSPPTSRQELAKYLGISPQQISNYTLGTSLPDYKCLYKLAKFFNVSADYLLGLQDAKSPNTDIQAIHNKTGLSEETIEELMLEMRILYGITNKTTPNEALAALAEYKNFVETIKLSNTDIEYYDYAKQHNFNSIYEDKIKELDCSVDLLWFVGFAPCCEVINAIMNDETPFNDFKLGSLTNLLHDVLTFKSTDKQYVIAEFFDDFDKELGKYVDLKYSPGNMQGLSSREIFSVKLYNLQQALTIRQNCIDEKNKKSNVQ